MCEKVGESKGFPLTPTHPCTAVTGVLRRCFSYITSKHLPKSSLNLLAFPAPKEADDSSEGVMILWGIFLALHLSGIRAELSIAQ